ncbi:hypothetical protein CEP53_004589 [Fusarium sp. AF-6]|nr:hypothetical protein CEP53_004589 [Fusarium sp. AF-6]
MPRARKIPRSEWEKNKQSICALFIDRDKSHEELVISMAEEHGFHASKAQYIRQLGEWNIKKYSTKKDWKHADALVRKRKIDGKETEILMNGKLISAKKLKKELGRYGWQQTYDQSFMVPDQDPPRHDLSASGTQIALVPFVNEVLITRPLAKTTSDAVSLMQEQIPPMPELDPTTQVVQRDPDPWSLALQWAVYRCTNNLLRPDQVDELLRFASATGNLAVLKGICRMRGPTTMALLSRLLPSAGADPEAGDGTYWDWSSLQIAAEDHNGDIVQLLLEHGADPNNCTNLNQTPLHLALIKPGELSLVKALVRAGGDFDSRDDPPGCHVSPLMAAIEQEWQYGAQVLIRAGADVNKPCTKPSSSDVYHDWGWNWDLNVPLVAAVLTDEVEFVQMLFDAGAELNAQTSRCLKLAVQYRSNDIVRLLLENGADPNQASPGSEAITPIHIAVRCEDYDLDTEVLKTLIEFGADVNANSGEGYPLEIISSEIMTLGEGGFKDYDLEEARDLLLQAHANPGLFNHSKLQRAAEKGDIAQVQSLIASGEDVNEPANDNGGATALQHAAMHGHLGIAMLLIENGAHINAPRAKTRGRTALQGAAENGRLDMVHLLLEHDDEPELLAERRRDAAKFADEEGHWLIRDILEGCNDHESSC